jgi:hypothetical protein
MKRRYLVSKAVYLVMAIVSLFTTSVAIAQELLAPMPLPVGRTCLLSNRFYFYAGFQCRSIGSLRVSQDNPTLNYTDPGNPAFGPSVPGPFGTGTGVRGYPNPSAADLGSSNPNVSGIWRYNNGYIDPRSPGYPQILDTTGDFVLRPADSQYLRNPDPNGSLAQEVQLGRFVFDRSNCSGDDSSSGHLPSACPADRIFNIGSFQINDPVSQTNAFIEPNSAGTLGTVAGTTRVNWSRVIDGSYVNPDGTASPVEIASKLLAGQGMSFDTTLDKNAVGLVLELGYQAGNFFDVFYGFAPFALQDNISKSKLDNIAFGRRGYTDTFSFYSDFPAASIWPGVDFNSTTRDPISRPSWNTQGTWMTETANAASADTTQDVGGSGIFNFRLVPDGPGQGVFPVRKFYEVFPNGSTEGVQESVSQRMDFTVFENRFGGKSWVPLWGFGRFAVKAGGLLSPLRYDLTGSRHVESLGPNAPGVVLENSTLTLTGWRLNTGVFLGSELEIAYNGILGRATIEYNACKDESFQLLTTNTTFNPGGLGASFTGGVTF